MKFNVDIVLPFEDFISDSWLSLASSRTSTSKSIWKNYILTKDNHPNKCVFAFICKIDFFLVKKFQIIFIYLRYKMKDMVYYFPNINTQ